MKVIDEFYYSEEFYNHFNNTFITFIPKKKRATELRDCHLISLLSSVYEIILKLLVGRLKSVMKGIIPPPKGAFIESRQILDGVIIVNNVLKIRDYLLKVGRFVNWIWKKHMIM